MSFPCESCKRSFATDQARQAHLRDNPRHNHPYCSKCNRYFYDSQALALHVDDHHHVCVICKQEFTKANFDDHLMKKHGGPQSRKQATDHACAFGSCGSRGFTLSQLEVHLNTVHRYCSKCKVTFASSEKFNNHIPTSKLHFYCPACCVEFASAAELSQHYRQSHYYCRICCEHFLTYQEYINHLLTSTRHNFCHKCSKDFDSAAELTKHYLTRESWSSGVLHYYCIPCCSNFDDDEGLKLHYLRSNAHHYCYKCNQTFPSESEMNSHFSKQLADHHYCDACRIVFKSREEHVGHAKQDPFHHHYCSLCSIIFPSAAALVDHKIQTSVHYYCAECAMDFPNVESLIEHLKRLHHYCQNCDRPFRTYEELVKHMVTTEDHYYCQECKVEFLNEASFHTHLETTHYYRHHCEKRSQADRHYCYTCCVEFPEIETLNLHLETKHHHCIRCQEIFDTENDLKFHKSTNNSHYYCQECNHEFTEAESLSVHRQAKHHYCGKCDVDCYSSAKLAIHKAENSELDHKTPEALETSIVDRDMHNDNGKQEIGFSDETYLNEQAEAVDNSNRSEKETNKENIGENITDEREIETKLKKLNVNPSQIKCLICSRHFSCGSAMLAHLEGRKCYLLPWQLYAFARVMDPRHAFTTAAITEPFFPALPLWDPIVISSSTSPSYDNWGGGKEEAPRRYACPRPWCGSRFAELRALVEHLESSSSTASSGDSGCGSWVKGGEGDEYELEFLRGLLV
ncbi:hypothetical protein F4809DRAFT_643196 [Biscogniauxia mediterranea]|nr:hypothetical protein F4809DRAFT_643196 [Biscogniauxia mediterranea]